MPRFRRPSWRRSPQPRFYWLGTLIVLPALLLAASGLHALQQDRVLAEHQAAEEASRLSEELTASFLRELFPPSLPGVEALEKRRADPGAPADDPITRLNTRPLPALGCFVSGEGRLAYPDSADVLPAPAPLELDELTPEQLSKWFALLAVWHSPKSAHDAPDLLNAFSALSPPARFVAIARMKTAVLQRHDGEMQGAAALLRSVIDSSDDALGESGYPLKPFAELQLLPRLPEKQRPSAANALCGRAVVSGSRLAPMLLERAGEIEPSVRGWQSVLKLHEQAREHWRACTDQGSSKQLTIGEEEQLPLSVPVDGGHWVLAISMTRLRELAERLAHSTSGNTHFFGVTVTLGQTALTSGSFEGKPLATTVRPVQLANDADTPLQVSVYLADRAGFFAQQHARSVRFGALIAAAAGAVLIGFFAAWRAFHHQLQLSEMKTNFVSSVSHELRAPIASVRLMAEELDGGATVSFAPEKLQQYHRFIVQECRRLSSVIENVLDFSRREQGREEFEFEPTDLVRLVEETVRVMQFYAAEKQLSIETQLRGEPCAIEADGRALQRLLVNLVDNAIKHSPAHSAVRVNVEFNCVRAALSVEDSGPGIPLKEQARIFERFYRLGSELRRETQGVGLGLSIVKHVATVHGGRVLVQSAPGKGSRFIVELPCETQPHSTGIHL